MENYRDEENTWELSRNLENAQEAIQEFYDKYPTAVRRLLHVLEKEKKNIAVNWNRHRVFETKI